MEGIANSINAKIKDMNHQIKEVQQFLKKISGTKSFTSP